MFTELGAQRAFGDLTFSQRAFGDLTLYGLDASVPYEAESSEYVELKGSHPKQQSESLLIQIGKSVFMQALIESIRAERLKSLRENRTGAVAGLAIIECLLLKLSDN
jgi:hypothetical protein